jgi:hypothetical protein
MLAAIRVLRRSKSFQPHFVAIFAAWIAYLIQAAISINQVGVGIWGWLFSGALIGYEIATREEQDSKKISASRKFTEVSQLPAKAALVGIFCFIVGFGLSFIPFHADSQFKNALQSGDVRKLSDSSQALGATSFHMELALDSALKANDVDAADKIVRDIIARYPRDFMAWRVRQVLVTATEAEREEAYRILRDMDPYNPEIRRVQ